MEETRGGDEFVKPKRIRRNRKFISNEIMKAVSAVIGQQGFKNLGINSVALEAKVEKPFIYRNYGGFEKVLEEYILKNDYWLSFILQRSMEGKVDDLGNVDAKGLYNTLMTDLYKTMDENRDFRNLILWELYENTPFIRKVAQRRETETKNEIDLLSAHFANSSVDIAATTSLMIAGIYYLVLHKDISTFCGIDFKTKEGKKRLSSTLTNLTNLLFEQAENQKSLITRMLDKGLAVELIAEITETSVEQVQAIAKQA